MAGLDKARESLIVALDFSSERRCFEFLDLLQSGLRAEQQPLWVKVGLELFLAAGSSLLRKLFTRRLEVFLDLKFHDIPSTVAGAVRSVLPFKPALLTVHASGGPAMLAEAANAAAGSQTRLLAVTVVTSMDADELAATGIVGTPAAQVERLATLAENAGIRGLVCSPRELPLLRRAFPDMHLVTPGIRPADTAADDQHRTATPAQAIRDGADQLVVGRPITAAQDPVRAYLKILDEIASA